MLDWLDAIPNLGVPGVPGVEPQKTVGFAGTPWKSAGVPGVPAGVTQGHWRASLDRLRLDRPPPSLDGLRWSRLVEDAWWLYENHARQLAGEGWSDLDAFGVSQRRPGGEVLLDRLDGSRRLHLDGKGRAAWSWGCSSVIMQACAGYADLQPAGAILPIWGLAHG